MKVLIEGPDGSGKSMLAQEIMKRWILAGKQCAYKHIVADDNQECNVPKLMRLLNTNENILFDRGHLSNVVYHAVYGDGYVFSDDTLRLFDQEFDLIIIALPYSGKVDEYKKHFDIVKKQRAEKYEDDMTEIYRKFHTIYDMSQLYNNPEISRKVVLYDFTESTNKLFQFVDLYF